MLVLVAAACAREPVPATTPPVTVSAPIAGTVVAVTVAPGEAVVRGTVVARFDTAPLLEAVRAAEAELAVATEGRGEVVAAAAGKLTAARAAATAAQIEAQRLIAEAGAGRASRIDRDNAIAAARAAEIAANGADIALGEARATLEGDPAVDARIAAAVTGLVGARRALEAATVTSTLPGRVAAVRVAPGSAVARGAPLVELVPVPAATSTGAH